MPVEEAGQPIELSQLVSATDEPLPVATDLAVPETASEAGTVAFDASHVAEQGTPPSSISTESAPAATHDESQRKLEIPFAEPVAEVDFDDLIAEELPQATSEPDVHLGEVEAPHDVIEAPVPTIEESAQSSAHVEAVAESEDQSHLPIEIAPPSAEIDFDDLIAGELPAEQASEPERRFRRAGCR